VEIELPHPRSPLIGRAAEVERVTHMIDTSPLVTVTGVGGVGKTRVAVQSAAELATTGRRAWFVELADVRDPRDVANTVAVAIGAPAIAEATGALAAVLGGEPTLLVLDNCEHVLEATAAVVDGLLSACPELVIIATSREPLGADGEHVLPLRPLDPAMALTLLRRRIRTAGGDLVGASETKLADLCRRLDGLPLAIELVAARVAALGLSAVMDGLDGRLVLLDTRNHHGDDRQETMRSTIEWSYRLLSCEEQQLLRWLSVFRGGVELDAVTHIGAAIGFSGPEAVDRLASLVHKNLVASDPDRLGPRYHLLEAIRAFAAEMLDQAGEQALARAAHAAWVSTITDLPYADPCSAAVERNSIRLEREADNWRAAVGFAVESGSGDLGARLCGPPVAYFLLGRHDLADVVRPLVDLSAGDDRRTRAVLSALIVSASGATGGAQLQRWASRVRTIDHRDPTGLGGLMQWMAFAWRGDFAAAVDLCVAESLDRRYQPATRDLFVGIATLDHFSLVGATEDPHGLIPRALRVAERSPVALTRVCCRLGAAWGLAGTDPDESLRLVHRALDDIDDAPALTRLTLPGSASRLLTVLDPAVAARGLLTQLTAAGDRRSSIDLIPLFYAAKLLQGVGHPGLGETLQRVTVSPVAPYLSMMDFVDLARRAAAAEDSVPLRELEGIVHDGLVELVEGGARLAS
jgi:predicted ATPase